MERCAAKHLISQIHKDWHYNYQAGQEIKTERLLCTVFLTLLCKINYTENYPMIKKSHLSITMATCYKKMF